MRTDIGTECSSSEFMFWMNETVGGIPTSFCLLYFLIRPGWIIIPALWASSLMGSLFIWQKGGASPFSTLKVSADK